jgi:hypothetical protein
VWDDLEQIGRCIEERRAYYKEKVGGKWDQLIIYD